MMGREQTDCGVSVSGLGCFLLPDCSCAAQTSSSCLVRAQPLCCTVHTAVIQPLNAEEAYCSMH